MQRRLIEVMIQTVSLISPMKDVSALDDDKVANTLFSSLKNKNIDIGAFKQLALSLLYSLRLLCKKETFTKYYKISQLIHTQSVAN